MILSEHAMKTKRRIILSECAMKNEPKEIYKIKIGQWRLLGRRGCRFGNIIAEDICFT